MQASNFLLYRMRKWSSNVKLVFNSLAFFKSTFVAARFVSNFSFWHSNLCTSFLYFVSRIFIASSSFEIFLRLKTMPYKIWYYLSYLCCSSIIFDFISKSISQDFFSILTCSWCFCSIFLISLFIASSWLLFWSSISRASADNLSLDT